MNEELERNIKQLNQIIINSYQSYYYLIEFVKHEPKEINPFYFPYLNLYNYLLKVFKEELCLNLYKLYFDNDCESFTIKKLNQEIYLCLKIKYSGLTKTYSKKFKKKITDIRHQSIAHNDRAKDNIKMDISELLCILNEIRDNFNKIIKDSPYSNYVVGDSLIKNIESNCIVAIDLVFSGAIKEDIEMKQVDI